MGETGLFAYIGMVAVGLAGAFIAVFILECLRESIVVLLKLRAALRTSNMKRPRVRTLWWIYCTAWGMASGSITYGDIEITKP